MKPIRLRSALLGAVVVAAAGTLSASLSFAAGDTSIAKLSKETHFHGIAVDPADSTRLFLATHHGLYLTGTDGKAQLLSEVRDYMGFTAHPTDASILFASGHPAGGGNLGFITSKDGGRTWTKLSDGVGGPVDFHQMDVSKADPRVIYGIYESLQRSDDGGRTWKKVGAPPTGIIGLAASSSGVNTLYAATESGIQRSTDGGKTWKKESDQIATMVHVAADGTVYAFMIGQGLVRATEKNLAWRVVSGGFKDEYLLHFAVDPRDPKRLYAVKSNPKTRTQSVIASRDGGEHWAPVGPE
ncbi:MAG TPA: exo-alpha-sialidase [Xanthobacteraceae bacterium]|nr:exo-alpha-sialidase [Xanthobacteraceae bacterium]